MSEELKTYNSLIGEALERYGLKYNNSGMGLALHKVSFDNNQKSFNYECVAANNDFIEILGIKGVELSGLRYEIIFPETKENKFDWKALLGHIGNHQSYAKFYCFSASLNKWCRFVAFSPNKGEAILVAEDISIEKVMEIQQNMEKSKSTTTE